MQSKERKYYLDLLNNFFTSFILKSSSNKNFKYWPVLKIQSGYFLFLYSDNKIAPNSIINKIHFVKQKISLFDIKNIFTCSYRIFKLSIKYSRRLKNKVLLFGFSEHYYEQNNELVNLYLSPLEKIFKKNNISYDKLLFSNNQSKPENIELLILYNTIYSYENSLFKVRDTLFNTSKKLHQFTLMYEKFLSDNSLSNSAHIANIFYKTYVQQEIKYRVFLKFLKITQPKSIWSYCYYDNNVMALNRAANRLKIKNIEYQHSQQSDEHFAYAKWNNIELYNEYFPNTFWVWEQRDADRIVKNFYGDNYKPNVIVGGNIAVIQDKVKYGKKEPEAERGILVSLQGVWIPDFVQQVIEEDTEHRWYFRLHPRYPEDKQKLFDFKNRFPDKVEIELANSLSLYKLFAKVKANIVDFSGVALEAEQFGVKNIVIGERGKEVYTDKIVSGIYYFADDRELLKKTLAVDKVTGTDFEKLVIGEQEKFKKIITEEFA